jgi:hemolysin activation/secretion protein
MNSRVRGRELLCLWGAVLAVDLAAPVGAVHAQISVPLNQLPRPRDEPLPEPPPVVPKPKIELPPPPAPGAPALSGGIRVTVRAFRFVGNTVIPEAELQEIAAPYVGRSIGNAELEELRLAITRRYVEAGYVNSGAIVPDQDVSDGVITIQIVEGRLSEIIIGGPNRFAADYLRDRIALGAGPPLNVNELQERMQIMLQDPQIERMSAELAPGVERGDAVLRVDVAEAKRFLAGITIDNNRSPVVGENQAELFFGARNLLGRGDTWFLRTAFTEGLQDYSGGFTLPLTARGLLFFLRGTHTNSKVVEEPLAQLDLRSESESVEAGLSYPLLETVRGSLVASVQYAYRTTQNTFLGLPSPFIPGAPDGRNSISVVRVGLDGVARAPAEVVAGRVLVSRGIEAFGSTVNGDPLIPDTRFTAVLGQLQWVRQVVPRVGQIVLRGDVQLANEPLLSPERYSLGGLDSVRGYRKDLYVRDNGWFASLEYRHLVGHLPVRPNPAPGEGAFRLVAFADGGQAWDKNAPPNVPKTLSSIGAGARWEIATGVEAQIFYGYALNDVQTPTTTLSDNGWYFRLVASYPF